MNSNFINTIIKPNTMTTRQSIMELANCLNEVVDKKIDGDFVECGTWRGGLAALLLYFIISKNLKKHLYIYDTFEGMTLPNELDISVNGEKALNTFHAKSKDNKTSDWCNAGLDIVENTLNSVDSNYKKYTSFIKGKVEDTLTVTENLPKKISLIRLDTDWYESTKLELEIFYNKISPNGILILDDYNFWAGQKQATDEFLNSLSTPPTQIVNGENYSLVIRK